MELSPEQSAAIRLSYRRRRTFMRGLLGVVLLVWLVLVGAMFSGRDTGTVGFAVWMTLVIVVGICSLTVWRCPRCGVSLGRTFGDARCPRCFVAFDVAPEDVSESSVN